MVAEARDLALIEAVLDKDDLPDNVRAAFEDMQFKIDHYPLTKAQRAWARAVIVGEKYDPGEEECPTLWASGKIPRGADVPLPDILKRENLPLMPPGRRITR